MKEGNKVVEALIVAASIVVFGLCVKGGIDNFVNKDRKVTVKGLSEREVQANTVTWPISTRVLGNDLSQLYNNANRTTEVLLKYLTDNGISRDEVTLNPYTVNDRNANQWSENKSNYRYDINVSMTVKTDKVDAVRQAFSNSGELVAKGIIFDSNWVSYDYTEFQDLKIDMMKEAIKNAEEAARQFSDNSDSHLGGILQATQGQLSIEDRDETTPYIKKIRVVTTVTYALND